MSPLLVMTITLSRKSFILLCSLVVRLYRQAASNVDLRLDNPSTELYVATFQSKAFGTLSLSQDQD